MPWLPSKRKRRTLGWIALMLLIVSGCASSKTDKVDAFFCDPQPAYTDTGAPDVGSYRVSKACLRGLTARVKACYKPQ